MKTTQLKPIPVSINASNKAFAAPVRAMKWEVLSRHRSRPHFERKFYHFLMGLICFGLYAFVVDRKMALLLLAAIGGPLVVLDLLRLRYPQVNAMALRFFGKIMRREELKSVSGNSFYVVGLLTIVALFPKTIVLLSVLYLAIGDPTAAIIGSMYGKHKIIGKKSLEGAAANWLFSAIASLIFALAYLNLSSTKALLLSIIGASISVIAELCPAPIDDNFTIPVISATLLSAVSFLFF